MLAHAGSFITPSDYKHVGQGVKCQRDAKSKEIWGKQVRQMNWTSPASILLETLEWKVSLTFLQQ